MNYGTFSVTDPGSTISCGGNWCNYNVFNPGQAHVYFTGSTNNYLIGFASTTFNHVTIQKQGTAILSILGDVTIQNQLIIQDGTLSILTTNFSAVTGPVEVEAFAQLDIQPNSALKLGNNVAVWIKPYGIFSAVGTSKSNRPLITSINPITDRYSFAVSGTINAFCYQFDHLDAHGLVLDNDANIQCLDGGIFTEPAEANTLITYRTRGLGAPDKVYGISFSGSPTNCYNTSVLDSGTDPINFEDTSGELSGSEYENDPHSLVSWSSNGPPAVTSVDPVHQATAVGINANIKVSFSKGLDPDTINTTNIVLKEYPSGNPITGVVTYDHINKQVIFNPTGNLLPDTTYTVEVNNGVKDWVAQAVTPESETQFTTGIGETHYITSENSPYTVNQDTIYEDLYIAQGGELRTTGNPVLTANTLVLDGKMTGNITIIAGNFTINATGLIDGKGKGGAQVSNPSTDFSGGDGGAFFSWLPAGHGANKSLTPRAGHPPTSIKYPFYLSGTGGMVGTAPNDPGGPGGGASVNITVDSTFTLYGTIDMSGADGSPDFNNETAGGGGSGGSVFIKCDTVVGTGTIDVSGGDGGSANYPGGGGSGGCIALHHEDYYANYNFNLAGGAAGDPLSMYTAGWGSDGLLYNNECQPGVRDICVGGEPVELSRGEFYQDVTDLTIPGRGFPFRFSRSYRSKSTYDGPLGFGWDFNYNARIDTSAGYADYHNGLGAKERYYNVGGQLYAAPGCYNTFTYASSVCTLTERDGTVYTFTRNPLISTLYHLTLIKDRNDNTLSLNYGDNPNAGGTQHVLLSITDTLGRIITFEYTAEDRIDSMYDWTNRTVDFTYDTNGDLWKVRSPITDDYLDGKTTVYTYTSGQSPARLNHNLETMTDPEGHEYLKNYYNSVDRCIQQDYGSDAEMETFYLYYHYSGRVTETDRLGNIKTYYLWFTGNALRSTLSSFTTYYSHSRETERTGITFPEGNSIAYTFDTANSSRRAQGNLQEIRRTASGESDIVTSFTYESNFNQVKTSTDAKGKITTFWFDYEEATYGDLNG
ncbi:Ig-like domain-containing protein, partial [Planctomycetota bacterium]